MLGDAITSKKVKLTIKTGRSSSSKSPLICKNRDKVQVNKIMSCDFLKKVPHGDTDDLDNLRAKNERRATRRRLMFHHLIHRVDVFFKYIYFF